MGGRRYQDVLTALGVVMVLGACVIPALMVVFSDKPVDTANIVAGVVAPAAIGLPTLVWLVRRWRKCRQAPPVSTAVQLAQAADQLAQAMLAAWRQEAIKRRITTPAPVRVQWHWSSEQVWSGYRSAIELVPGAGPAPIPAGSTAVGEVLAAGVVTRLHDELYTRLPHGRLVLIGVGGAGKTGAMILLLLAALAHRNSVAPDQRDQVPVPVWLTLGGWNPQTQSLPEWASATIYRDHPYLRSAEFGAGAVGGLLLSGRLALFLDGLDEIASELRAHALAQVEAASAGLRIVLTSRPEEYQQASQSSRWHNVAEVQLCPVDPATAHAYLITDQHGDQRDGWDEVGAFLQAHPDSVAARVLNNPLTLSLARDAYRHADPRALTTDFTNERALWGHLIERSLTVAYPNDRECVHATYWLGWIAYHMSLHSRDLAWWQIPNWLKQRRLRLTTALLGGTVATLILGLAGGLAFGATFGLIFGLIAGLILGRILGSGINTGDEPKSFSLRWPRPLGLVAGLAGGVVGGSAFGLLAGLAFGVVGGSTFGVVGGLAFGLVAGLGAGLMMVFDELARTPLPQRTTATPTSAFHADRRTALLQGLMYGLIFGLAIGLEVGVLFGLGVGIVGLVVGLAFGLVVGLVGGLVLAAINSQSFAILMSQIALKTRSTEYVNFLQLLQDANRRQVLRQAGAVYQFRHAALQDHLAEMYRHRHLS